MVMVTLQVQEKISSSVQNPTLGNWNEMYIAVNNEINCSVMRTMWGGKFSANPLCMNVRHDVRESCRP